MMTSDFTIVSTTYGRQGYKWYKTAEVKLPIDSSGSGCSAVFYKMGAEAHSDEFGLKVFGERDECLAAYQRQALAFRHGIAPPVGRLLLVTQRSQWDGKLYECYAHETGICSEVDRKIMNEIHALPWKEQRHHPIIKDLRRSLRRVDLTGTILNDVFRYGRYDRNDLDILVPSGSGICLGGDLHTHNYMMWQNRLVCIDFGHHSILTSRHGSPAPLCEFNCTRAAAAKRVARQLGIRA